MRLLKQKAFGRANRNDYPQPNRLFQATKADATTTNSPHRPCGGRQRAVAPEPSII
ncbi:MAG: hypothetical protein WCH39_18095 [Schlesneria sp.]